MDDFILQIRDVILQILIEIIVYNDPFCLRKILHHRLIKNIDQIITIEEYIYIFFST